MERYSLIIENQAKKQLADLYKSGDQSSVKKIEKIFEELEIHPTTGSGNPKQLKHNLSEFWSRRINKKDRLIYAIDDEKVIVLVVSAKGHYFDK